MGSNTIWKNAIALSVLTMASGNLYASHCGSDRLPTTDDYYNIKTTLLDNKTVNQVRNFANRLDGKWHGTGIDVRCGLSDDEYLSTINNYDVDAEITKHFLGSLVMEVQQENADLVNLDTILLSPNTEQDSQGQKTGFRSYNVDLSSPDTLVYTEKYRTFNPVPEVNEDRPGDRLPVLDANGVPVLIINANSEIERYGVRLVHDIKTVSIGHNELTVNRNVYINGNFFSQQEWQLQRL